MTDAEILAELKSLLGITAAIIVRMAAVWAEGERRKLDLSPWRSGIYKFLSRIDAGAVIPEAAVMFAGAETVLSLVAKFPPDRQREIVNGEPVLLVVRQGDTFTHRMLPVNALQARQAMQALGDGYVRSEAEQIARLETTPRTTTTTVTMGTVTVDKRNKVVRIGKAVATLADVTEAMKAAGISW